MEALKDISISVDALLEQMQQSVITTDLAGRITSWNSGAEQLYGYEEDEVLGRPVSLIYAGGESELAERLENPSLLLGERNFFETEGWRVRKGGERVFVRVRISPLVAPGGERLGYVAFAVDITRHEQALEAIRRTQQSLVERNALYAALIKAQSDVGEGVIIIEDEKVTYANEAVCELLGYTPEEVTALPSFAALCDPSCRERVVSNHRRRVAGEDFEKRYPITVLTKDGRRKEIEIAVALIQSEGRTRVVVVFVDITERHQALQRVAYLALHDPLTGLANRTLLVDHLQNCVANSRRKRSRFGVFFIDLDGFKPINDQFGHKEGDAVLRQLGRRLLDAVRESDTVARVGGDEFVVLVNDVPDESAVVQVAEKLLETIARPFAIREDTRQIGASIGVALYPDHGKDVDALIQAADTAMYAAKRCGKNRYRLAV